MSDPILLIKDAMEKLDVRYSDRYIHAFSVYLEMLKKWSRAYNLTSIRKDREIVIKHFIDSLSYLEAISESATTLLDVGTGAGFPGVPIKIIRPDLKVFLIEPSRKKILFLQNLVKTLSLSDIYVLRCRIEDYPCGHKNVPEVFDVVLTRALFKIDEFIEKASCLCSEKGCVIISKGPSYLNELQYLDKREYYTTELDLKEYGLDRYLIVVRP